MTAETFPLRDEQNAEILMHRDVHFGGNFKIMLDYYAKKGKGVCGEFDLSQIETLAEIELRAEKNLAPFILSGTEAEKVARAKKAYKKLRDLYEKENLSSRFPLLIADLILTEEENPQTEIEAIVVEKNAIVPALLELLKAEDYYDSLFPGYGQAPALAAKCLGMIGDKRAIIALFEGLGAAEFKDEENLLQALQAIGEPAKQFLLNVVKAHPINTDNEKAAIALLSFKDDPHVAKTCLELLDDPEVRKDFALSTYLVLVCEGLRDDDLRQKFAALADNFSISSALVRDIKSIANAWKKK